MTDRGTSWEMTVTTRGVDRRSYENNRGFATVSSKRYLIMSAQGSGYALDKAKQRKENTHLGSYDPVIYTLITLHSRPGAMSARTHSPSTRALPSTTGSNRTTG